MKISGIHILLTYQCTFECDHCFVWGSPWQSGTLTLAQIERILEQAQATGVEEVYFEGGEPFLYYAILRKAVELAVERGFQVGIVSNGYWAHTREDAREWLAPLAGKLSDLSISSDLYHYSEENNLQTQNAVAAAKDLGIPVGTISIAQPEAPDSSVMYRGRAWRELAPRATQRSSWKVFTKCPHEDLRDPGRIHLDPLGNLHICQGISLGNLFETDLAQVCTKYDADAHPICGPLLQGGPAALVSEYNLPHASEYADACQLCYEARSHLRPRFPEVLGPDQMYGVGL
jgi:hypothetical protein